MRVRLRAWGFTAADVSRAIDMAGAPPGRAAWEFEVERLGGATCPLDVRDPTVIAADAGYHWAYCAYPAADLGGVSR